MKNNIAYYLEDPKRLDEVTLLEINGWIEEMPYSQPLRLLADMKSDRFVANQDEHIGTYGAYFAEDYEWSGKKKGSAKNKNQETPELGIKVEPIVGAAAVAAASVSGILASAEEKAELTNAQIEEDKVIESTSDTSTSNADTATIRHPLAADDREDTVEEEVLEINKVVEVVHEVSHVEASESGEDEIVREVMELDWEEVQEVNSLSEIDNDEADIGDAPGVDEWKGNVDYGSFVSSYVPSSAVEVDPELPSEREMSSDKPVLEEEKSVKKRKPKSNKKSTTGKASKGGKNKSKAKRSYKDEYDTEKAPIAEGDGLSSSTIEVKEEKSKDKSKKKKKSKKSKELKSERKKISKKGKKGTGKAKIKHVKKQNTILKTEEERLPKSKIKKLKKSKKKGKKSAKGGQARMTDVQMSKNNFKLTNYEGVSNFTNWLLKQKTVNGDQPLMDGHESDLVSEQQYSEKVRAKKKKKKGKKKKKKSKTIIAAQDSIKKAEVIISEPLADILAAQGHTKKARKMYKQLSLIFPEKSSYFAAKIENLKNI